MLKGVPSEWLTVNISGDKFRVPRRRLISKSIFFKNLLKTQGVGCDLVVTVDGLKAKPFEAVVDWLKTSELNISQHNLVDLYDIADNLDIPEILGECKEFIKVTLLTSNPVFFYDQMNKSRNESLRRFGIEIFAENFHKITTGRIYYNLDVKSVCFILSNDNILVSSEKEVFEAAVRWLMYSWVKRRRDAVQVLNCVRFALMEDEELLDCNQRAEYNCVTQIPECQKLLVKALLFKAATKSGKSPPCGQTPKPRNFPYQVPERNSLLHFCNLELPKATLDELDASAQPFTDNCLHQKCTSPVALHCHHTGVEETVPKEKGNCCSPLRCRDSPRNKENKCKISPERKQQRQTGSNIVHGEETTPHSPSYSSWSVVMSQTSEGNFSESLKENRGSHVTSDRCSPRPLVEKPSTTGFSAISKDSRWETKSNHGLLISEVQCNSRGLSKTAKKLLLSPKDGLCCTRTSSCPSIILRDNGRPCTRMSPHRITETNCQTPSAKCNGLNETQNPRIPKYDFNSTINSGRNSPKRQRNISQYLNSVEENSLEANTNCTDIHKNKDKEQILPPTQQNKAEVCSGGQATAVGSCLRKPGCASKIRSEKGNVSFKEEMKDDRDEETRKEKCTKWDEKILSKECLMKSTERRLNRTTKAHKTDGVSIVVFGGLNPLQHWGSSKAGYGIFHYAIASRQWSESLFLPEPRHHPGIACLDYKIYIIGGCNPHLAQNGNRIRSIASVLCYDVGNDLWSTKCPMRTSRIHHSVVTRNGKIFAIGGLDERNRLLRSVECYNPYKNEWTELASLSSPRMAMAAAIHNGEIWVCGGIGYLDDSIRQKSVLATVENYNFTSNSWSRRNPLRIPRCFSTLVDSFGQLLLLGGAADSPHSSHQLCLNSIATVDVFHESQQQWQLKATLLCRRHSCASALLGRHLYLIGGVTSEDAAALPALEQIDLLTLRCQWLPPMPLALSGMVAVCVPSRRKTSN